MRYFALLGGMLVSSCGDYTLSVVMPDFREAEQCFKWRCVWRHPYLCLLFPYVQVLALCLRKVIPGLLFTGCGKYLIYLFDFGRRKATQNQDYGVGMWLPAPQHTILNEKTSIILLWGHDQNLYQFLIVRTDHSKADTILTFQWYSIKIFR